MKRLVAALLCVMMIVLLLPTGAMAEYTAVSNRGDELQLPEAGNFFETPFYANVHLNDYIQAIYIMPQPETGHGHLGSVRTGSQVYVLGEQNGFFFFMKANGERGWAWAQGFYYDEENVSLKKAAADADVAIYPTRSTAGYKLRFPADDQYLAETRTGTVQTKTACGSIYLMPRPDKGHGNLGTVACGEEVTVLAENGDGYVFFQTADGRYGWNSEAWFA